MDYHEGSSGQVNTSSFSPFDVFFAHKLFFNKVPVKTLFGDKKQCRLFNEIDCIGARKIRTRPFDHSISEGIALSNPIIGKIPYFCAFRILSVVKCASAFLNIHTRSQPSNHSRHLRDQASIQYELNEAFKRHFSVVEIWISWIKPPPKWACDFHGRCSITMLPRFSWKLVCQEVNGSVFQGPYRTLRPGSNRCREIQVQLLQCFF